MLGGVGNGQQTIFRKTTEPNLIPISLVLKQRHKCLIFFVSVIPIIYDTKIHCSHITATQTTEGGGEFPEGYFLFKAF